MRFFSLVTAAMAAPVVLAGTTGRAGRPGVKFGCGSPDPTAEQIEVAASFAAQEARFAGRRPDAAAINVDVYFHVVAQSKSLTDGYATVCLSSCPQAQTCPRPNLPQTRLAPRPRLAPGQTCPRLDLPPSPD
jgi:hypothetical protein